MEDLDIRKQIWIGNTTDGVNTFFYPFKYKVLGQTEPAQEYSMVFRLTEQYLIRAEARAQAGNVIGAQTDLNLIRNRAGLSNISSTNANDLLLAIEKERRHELFTEWGHRWLDLKRTERISEVMSDIKPNWESTDVLFPIPQTQIDNNPNTSQNPGY